MTNFMLRQLCIARVNETTWMDQPVKQIVEFGHLNHDKS